MSALGFQESSFAAQLVALNALFESARAGEAGREQALFIAFGEDMCSELARLQLEEVLDALCRPGQDTAAGALIDDLRHFEGHVQRSTSR